MRSRSTRLATDMSPPSKHRGVVVPMVTPVTAAGTIDTEAVDRLVEVLLSGGVQGIFVLGTTGEGSNVADEDRQRLVRQVASRVASRAWVYAGIGDLHPKDAEAGNAYLEAGADAVVARPPIAMPESELAPWYRSLLEDLRGPMVLYNIPMLTGVSIPLELVADLLGHPRFVGMKDSENDVERMRNLVGRFGGRPEFSLFVGVGRLMEEGLRLGADGIVPSVGNLIPASCRALWDASQQGQWAAASQHAARMSAVAAIYQTDRDLNGSLCALKAALSLQRVCEKHMLPPLQALEDSDLQHLAVQLDQLQVAQEGASLSTATETADQLTPRQFPSL